MKTQLTVALVVLITCLVGACSKNDNPAPDVATQVAGTYELTKLQYDSAGISLYNYTLPLKVGTQSLSGTIVARRDSAAVVYATYTIKQTGQSDYTSTLGQLSLKGTSAPYDLYYGTTKVGTADGTVFTIDYTYTDQGTNYHEVYSGKKK